MSWKIAREGDRYYGDAETMPGAEKAHRLAAAAPDLLEALEGTAALLEALGYAADTSLTVGAARAAIAKAKGSQSYP